MLTCSLEDYGRSVSSGVSFYVGPVGGSGFVFLIILVVALCWKVAQLFGDSVLEVLVVVLVVVLVDCFYFRNTFHSEFTW